MKIYNPSNNAIENVSIFGVKYSISAEGTLDNVPEAHARFWQESLHNFLVLRKDKLETPTEEKVEVPEPKVKEVLEESAPEEVETVTETKEEITVPSPEDITKHSTGNLRNEIKKGKTKKVK